MPDLSDDIAEQAVEPLTSAADGQSATGRSTGELLEADRYLGNKPARKTARRGIAFSKLIPPASISDQSTTRGV